MRQLGNSTIFFNGFPTQHVLMLAFVTILVYTTGDMDSITITLEEKTLKQALTLLEEMNEIKGIGSKVQLAHPRNSMRG